MSRRKGQNPKLRIGTRSDGSQYFYFQYWLDVPVRTTENVAEKSSDPLRQSLEG
jgi:hypothetical protein